MSLRSTLYRLKEKALKGWYKSRFLFSGRRHEISRQIDRNFEHRNLDNAIIHSHRMIEAINRYVGNRKIKILSVGTCNMIEIHAFKGYGYNDIAGIDLVPGKDADRRSIRQMDMHDMSFDDSAFDLIYCSGTFQCTDDPYQLASEFIRVLKDGGMIALTVPTGFQPTSVYKLDVGTVDKLEAYFRPRSKERLWHEMAPPHSEFNPNAHAMLRDLFRISKS